MLSFDVRHIHASLSKLVFQINRKQFQSCRLSAACLIIHLHVGKLRLKVLHGCSSELICSVTTAVRDSKQALEILLQLIIFFAAEGGTCSPESLVFFSDHDSLR